MIWRILWLIFCICGNINGRMWCLLILCKCLVNLISFLLMILMLICCLVRFINISIVFFRFVELSWIMKIYFSYRRFKKEILMMEFLIVLYLGMEIIIFFWSFFLSSYINLWRFLRILCLKIRFICYLVVINNLFVRVKRWWILFVFVKLL